MTAQVICSRTLTIQWKDPSLKAPAAAASYLVKEFRVLDQFLKLLCDTRI